MKLEFSGGISEGGTQMKIGEVTHVNGFITRERFLLGKTPPEMAKILGFAPYRFQQGVWILKLLRLPAISGFEFAGYTYWRGGIPADGPPKIDFDVNKVKRHLIEDKWKLAGPDRLVKVVTKTPHQSEQDYMIGTGAEQWRLTAPVPAEVVADLASSNQYLPYASVQLAAGGNR